MSGTDRVATVGTAQRGSQPVVVDDATHPAPAQQHSKERTVSNPNPAPAQPRARTVRHAHLFLTRVDPWSVMKVAIMLSIALAIVTLVAVAVLWTLLAMSGTLSAITRTATDIAGTGAGSVDITALLSFSRVMGATAIIAFMEVILISALATLFAYLYNLAVALTGGLSVTLTEDQ